MWHTLEINSSLRAIPAVWRGLLGDDLEIFQATFLQPLPERARGVFCEKCYCTHEVVAPREYSVFSVQRSEPDNSAHKSSNPPIHQSGSETHHSTTPPLQHSVSPLVASCRCEDGHCPDIPLAAADIEVWALNWPRLARSLCAALGLHSRFADLRLFNTHQIGVWSADAVPVILTIQAERPQLSTIISQLSSRLRRPFILLAPTGDHLDAVAQEMLANAGAEFFALEHIVRLASNGALQAVKSGGELFVRFNPETKDAVDEDTARKAFALAKALDSEQPMKPPTLLTVFCQYCIEERSLGQIAQKYRCSKATVFRRLRMIHERTGIEPEQLRKLSPHFSRIEDAITDSRAAHIHRRRLIYDAEAADESE